MRTTAARRGARGRAAVAAVVAVAGSVVSAASPAASAAPRATVHATFAGRVTAATCTNVQCEIAAESLICQAVGVGGATGAPAAGSCSGRLSAVTKAVPELPPGTRRSDACGLSVGSGTFVFEDGFGRRHDLAAGVWVSGGQALFWVSEVNLYGTVIVNGGSGSLSLGCMEGGPTTFAGRFDYLHVA